VRALPGRGAEAERAVTSTGGRVERRIGIIDGVSADVPENAVPHLRSVPGIHSVTLNGAVHLQHVTSGFDADHDAGSMFNVAQEVTGAGEFWNDGYTGTGVDVALIDSGVVPVSGLTKRGKVVNGPDLSFESQTEQLRHLDTFGHGTHLAGIIGGRDDTAPTGVQKGNHDDFLGVAPDARILSVKVADAAGATDVSQVIAAIDWVVQHRTDNGMNIRVLNLAFGTDGVQDYTLDPLAYAVEVAWKKGIVVVVAAGNSTFGSQKMNNPAYNPRVIAVGAADGKRTYDTDDDVVMEWSARGDGIRNPDFVAPGKSLVSLRSPGSFVDQRFPEGRVGDRFFRGSGTSQAAAVVSGAAALIIQQRPSITPDQVKKLLSSTAQPIPGAPGEAQGAGMLDLKEARGKKTPPVYEAAQVWPAATGLGSLEAARGSVHVADDGVELRGEQDIFGKAWDGSSWSTAALLGSTWSGGTWNGSSWSGSSWSGSSWSGSSWSGSTWSGSTWSGSTWSGSTWSGSTWNGSTWSGSTWSGSSWSGSSWSSAGWGSQPIVI
jgi:subtilisin family serine protease